MRKSNKTEKIREWVYKSFINSVRLPAILFILVFLILNTINLSYMANIITDLLKNQVQEELYKATSQDAENIEQQLVNINYITEIYALQTQEAIKSPAQMGKEDDARLEYSPAGTYYTTRDKKDGGAAVFYSGYHTVGDKEREKVARVLQTENLMKDIQKSHPLAIQLYLNTFDSLNVIYPYFNVISQYVEKMDISQYNFYYEADAEHNPDRSTEWTDVYLDPAGSGWMASCIAPVYNDDFLEGVVGIDITVSTITQQVLDLDIPWEGYALLIDSNGVILALPEQGEEDWGLSEFAEHNYSEAIMQDTFKPDEFNLNNMDELGDFAREISNEAEGLTTIKLNNDNKVMSWATIDETEWKLLFVVPESTIYAGVNKIKNNEWAFELAIFCSLAVVYFLFSWILRKRINKLSLKISDPLLNINNMVNSIGEGEYTQSNLDFDIEEFQETSNHIVDMGKELGQYNKKLMDAQDALKDREAYLHDLVNSIDDAIYEVDENGVIKNFRTNDPRILKRVFPNGLKEETTYEEFLNKGDAEKYLATVREVINTGKTASIEDSTETFDGIRWFLARISLLDGGSRTAAVSLRDITDQKELEQSIIESRNEAEKASKAKSEFLSNMSHELRTPLNAVLGFAQLLEIDPEYPLSEAQQDSIYEIKKAGSHLLELINEVLDLAKIEAGRMTISIEPVSVAEIVNETFALVKPMAEKFGVKLVSHYKRCDRYVQTDKIRIKQILINLISNAIKYNKEKGQVTFYCEAIENKIRFHVVDTGIGIPSGQIDGIFKPFNRLSATKNLVEGTGIGLAMVKQLTELMGGSVHVESETGKGSHFYVELNEANMKNIEDKYENKDIECVLPYDSNEIKKRILYVEDNPANLNLVERIISYIKGLEMMAAPTAEIGIDMARVHCPDLILLDINLPDMDGYKLFKRLKGYDETKDIPIIAVSANAMEKDIRKALDLGFADYFTKPIDIPEFIGKLKEILNDKNNLEFQ